jgi:hypothetical protein
VQASVREPRDPPSSPGALAGVPSAFELAAEDGGSPLPRLELLVPALAVGFALLLLALARIPVHRVAGIAGGVALRRGEIIVVAVVVLNSILIGILIAQLGR